MTRGRFYNSRAWKECRAGFIISKNYLCERCGRPCYARSDEAYKRAKEQGYNVLFGIVHHKEYINDINIHDPKITLNWDNLELLCIECHNKEHMIKAVEIREDVAFDDMGNIVRSD